MNAPIKKLKVIKIGNSAGVVLPRELLDRLNLAVGDSLSCHAAPDGVVLSARNEEFDAQMVEARKLMGEYRNALRELAK
jgi:putative addiction module antidote